MPGPIVHLLVQQRLATALRRSEGSREFVDLLSKEPCSPYAGFGSMGPDFLFFSLREYGDAIGDLSNFIFEVYDTIEPIIEFVEETIEPVKTAIDDAVSAVLPDELEALLAELGSTAGTLGSAMLAKLGEIVTNEVDLFYPFYPKLQQGAPEDEWYWFDFLHYRRTGRFCSTMWRMVRDAGDPDLMRYCLGYASHIGTDVVGHPYVNSIVGGPYRGHWHRHKLVENWIDAWARRHYDDPPSFMGCLRIGPEDTYRPNSIAGSYYSRLCEFPDKRLPDKLSELFVAAQRETYGDIPHPPDFNPDDVDAAYRLWIRWFERATSIGDALAPTPPPPPGSAATALVTDYVNEISSIWSGAGAGGGGGGGGFSIWGIFAAIADFIRRVLETIAKTIEYIINHIDDILLLPLTEALRLIRWLVYQVHLGLWQIYDEARFALVLGGYLFADERDLAKLPWAEAFVNAGNAHMTGGPAAAFAAYPRKRQAYALLGQTEIHLVYPGTLGERPTAEPCPLPHFGVYPDVMIDAHTADPKADAFFFCEQAYPPDPSDPSLAYTHNVERATWKGPQFGSALPFSARLISEMLDDLPNFNLDGDRGYGFLTWRLDGVAPTDPQVSPAPIESNPVNVNYGPTV